MWALVAVEEVWALVPVAAVWALMAAWELASDSTPEQASA